MPHLIIQNTYHEQYINQMRKIMNSVLPNLLRLRIEGPINHKMEHRILSLMDENIGARTQAILLIINSYGGSLRSAKNIASACSKIVNQKRYAYLQYHRYIHIISFSIPVYCFAQQFCLNSANLILTAGTKCYANKLSIIGDFGYVYEGYNLQKLKTHFNIDRSSISNTKDAFGGLFNNHRDITNKYAFDLSIGIVKWDIPRQFIGRWVDSSEKDLREQIIRNRKDDLTLKDIELSAFNEEILEKGLIKPAKAIEYGLIDDLISDGHFIERSFKSIKVKDPQTASQYIVIQQLRKILNTIRGQ